MHKQRTLALLCALLLCGALAVLAGGNSLLAWGQDAPDRSCGKNKHECSVGANCTLPGGASGICAVSEHHCECVLPIS